ncbi:large-conductance mechanosensitive channel protein MscL [Corynebacterium ulceribovis]|uniref:large-conductance mechanosensitive channel protein MscL n=1 Tax=Corynebacterium ulceribovis TaxID=487732 RepID=UPI00037334C6|nr:large-conductance mechanosensitive channel protein MscL [Corynebacterium ulceribovis]
MLQGFKEFIMRGNVIDLAVGVVVGAAFTGIVTKFTEAIITPLLAVFGGDQELGWGFQLLPDNPATFVDLGGLVSAVINFLIIAAVVYFILVMPMNKLEERRKAKIGADEEEDEKSNTEILLEDIRDLLAKQDGEATGGAHRA